MTVEIRLLGPVEAVAGEETVPLGGPRQRALLALLALAEAPLRSYVSRFRSALGRERLDARRIERLLGFGAQS